MELGALVCTPAAPKCGACPAGEVVRGEPARACRTRSRRRPKPQAVTEVREVGGGGPRRGEGAALPPAGGRDAVGRTCGRCRTARCSPASRDDAAAARVAKELTGLDVEVGAEVVTIRHGVTRFAITLVVPGGDGGSAAGSRSDFYAAAEWVDPAKPAGLPGQLAAAAADRGAGTPRPTEAAVLTSAQSCRVGRVFEAHRRRTVGLEDSTHPTSCRCLSNQSANGRDVLVHALPAVVAALLRPPARTARRPPCSFATISSACWIGTSLSASPWMISAGAESFGDVVDRRDLLADLLAAWSSSAIDDRARSSSVSRSRKSNGGRKPVSVPVAEGDLALLAVVQEVGRREEAGDRLRPSTTAARPGRAPSGCRPCRPSPASATGARRPSRR